MSTQDELAIHVNLTGANYFPVSTVHKAIAAQNLAKVKHITHATPNPDCALCVVTSKEG